MASAVSFTYDVNSPIGKTRLYAGDIDGAGLNKVGGDRTRTDAEVGFLLSDNGNDPRRAAAALLETKANEYSQAAVKTEQGQLKQDFTQRGLQCLAAAKNLRGQSGTVSASKSSESPFSMEEMQRW